MGMRRAAAIGRQDGRRLPGAAVMCGRGLSARRSSWPRESCFLPVPAASESASLAGFDAVMGRVDDGFSCSPSDVPETFRDELFPVAGKRGLRCDVGSHLVGFEHAGSAPDALREVQDALERGGWRMTAAGQGLCATFSKDRGACRWAFVQCVQMPQGTSVVVQWSEYGKEVR